MTTTIKRTYSLSINEVKQLLSDINNNPEAIASKNYKQQLAVCRDSYCHTISNPNGGRATLFHGNKHALTSSLAVLKSALNKALSQKPNAVSSRCLSHMGTVLTPDETSQTIELVITVAGRNQVQNISSN